MLHKVTLPTNQEASKDKLHQEKRHEKSIFIPLSQKRQHQEKRAAACLTHESHQSRVRS